jgi:DNA-binding transcriptional regulator/RsmH inhibitor MraZ
MTATTTIRVPVETRDSLAQQAAGLGVSLSAMLTEQARQYAREEWFRAEREASRLDALNPEAMAEQELWEETADEDLEAYLGDDDDFGDL